MREDARSWGRAAKFGSGLDFGRPRSYLNRRYSPPSPYEILFRLAAAFLKRCTLAAAATGLPLWFVERQIAAAEVPRRPLSANDRPGIALIGCGGQGKGDTINEANHGDIVAVCDVNEARAAEANTYLALEMRAPYDYSFVG